MVTSAEMQHPKHLTPPALLLSTWTGQIRSIVVLKMSKEKQQPFGRAVKIVQDRNQSFLPDPASVLL